MKVSTMLWLITMALLILAGWGREHMGFAPEAVKWVALAGCLSFAGFLAVWAREEKRDPWGD